MKYVCNVCLFVVVESECGMEKIQLYRFLLVLRFVLVLIPQSGYIHPDEFFQSTEVVAGDIFKTKIHRTWEFNNTNPVRSLVFPYILCGIPFYLVREISYRLASPLVNVYLLLILPRLIITISSLSIDVLLKKISQLYKKDYTNCLIVYASSYVTLTYQTRTLSNSIETILFAMLIYFVTKSLFEIEQYNNKVVPDRSITAPYAAIIAAVCVAGTFNRPTFIIFSFAPVMIWLQFGSSCNLITTLNVRLSSLITGAVASAVFFIFCDSVYYDRTTDYFPNSVIPNSHVCTPCNFIVYNTDVDNLAKHGLHPIWLHSTVNVPLLFGSLGVDAFREYISVLIVLFLKRRLNLNLISSLMTSSFIFPVLILSLFQHQEPRFLIPLIFPLIYLHADQVWGKGCNLRRCLWLLFNFILLIFYGFLHQGGIVTSALDLGQMMNRVEIEKPTQLVFFHTYMPPRHLFASYGDKVNITDLAGADSLVLKETIETILNHDPDSTIFTFSPTSLRSELTKLSFELDFNVELVQHYPCHLSVEDPPKILFLNSKFLAGGQTISSGLFYQLGLDVNEISHCK